MMSSSSNFLCVFANRNEIPYKMDISDFSYFNELMKWRRLATY